MAVIFNIAESAKISAFNILQEPFKMLMETEVEAFEKQSHIADVYVMKTTDKFQEEFRSRTAMDGFKPTEDMEPAGLSDFGEGYRKVFRTQIWTNSFVVSKQTIEDNQMMDINVKAVGFIKSYGRTRELYAMKMLAGAVSGGYVTIDGKKFDTRGGDTTDGTPEGTPQNYFTNAHYRIGKYGDNTVPAQSNKFQAKVGNTYGLDLGSAGAVEKMADVISQVDAAMSAYKDEKGNLLGINPTTILIPGGQPHLRDAIEIGLKSKYGATMGGNGINPQYGKYTVIELPYLNELENFTLADQAFILMDPVANRDYLGAVWFDRTPLEIDSYTDKGNKANIWDGRARFGAGFNNFRAMAYVTTGASQDIATATDISVTPVGGGAIATKAIS